MNKDVIYIEPEDDITDIILKIENSKEKIVALVPPKKAGVFRSVVNIKLIAKAGVTSEKTVVLVTVDPSILKLAASAKLPVAKNLQSAPAVPKIAATEDEEPEEEELVEEESNGEEAAEDTEEETEEESDKEATAEDEDEDEDEEEEEKPAKKSKKKPAKKKGGLIGWIKAHKKLSIFFGIFAVGIVILLVWMLFIAPAVDIAVSIKTDQKNFSESVTFVDKLEDENAEEGKFFLEQKKIEEKQKVEFEATGQKNVGERAHGDLKITAIFNGAGSVAINAGKTQFTYNGLNYYADKDTSLAWDGISLKDCDKTQIKPSGAFSIISCQISTTIGVTAAEGGTKYNAPVSGTGWSTLSGLGVVSATAIEGGTDNVITVVKQSDVLAAQEKIVSAKGDENKEKLYKTIDEKYYVIDSSFEQSTSNATATPAADEEVKEGVKPSLEVTTVATVYVIDKVKLEEFITKKATLDEEQKIYDIKDIYVENMDKIAVGASTKLKAKYFVGPELTETKLVEMIQGKGLGDARREISDIHGVSDVTINPSYPWVMMVPTDSNRITIKFEVKDQDGNNIEKQEDDNNDEENKEDGEKDEESDSKKDDSKDKKE